MKFIKFSFNLAKSDHVTNTTFLKNGVKSCATIVDQDNKINSTLKNKGKKNLNVVCEDTYDLPTFSHIESLREVHFSMNDDTLIRFITRKISS